MIIIAGALYAALFAWSRIYAKRWLMSLAYAAYAVLFASVMVLANTLHLTGFWQIVVVAMLIGYLLAPHGIWHLCIGTHCEEEGEAQTESTPSQ